MEGINLSQIKTPKSEQPPWSPSGVLLALRLWNKFTSHCDVFQILLVFRPVTLNQISFCAWDFISRIIINNRESTMTMNILLLQLLRKNKRNSDIPTE